MCSESSDPKCSRLLSLAVHELRAPLSPGSGYLRMVLTTSDGTLTERQRHLAGESQKAWGRMTTIVQELSELSDLEAGKATFVRKGIDLRRVLAEAVAGLPPVEAGAVEVEVKITTRLEPCAIEGDPVRLREAFKSVVFALRRELATSTTLFVREEEREYNGRSASWIAIGDADHIDMLAAATPGALATFDEWRGGCGMKLPIARRVIEAHGGAVWSPGDKSKAGAVMVLPR